MTRTAGTSWASLGLAALLLVAATAGAEDWPTYRHDAARSGVTSETLPAELAELWTYRASHAPEPAWGLPKAVPVEGILELPRVHFDDAFQVAVADGKLFFGSSADHKVHALDASTGQEVWSAFTGGPVRLAPTVWRDRVLVGSDDGCVYGFRASDGGLAWKFEQKMADRKVLGHGRMISLCPVRTGVLVDDDTAYFAAGIWPTEGVCLYAVHPDDGAVRWKNDWAAEDARSSLSPQGYLLASKTRLFAPMGRVSPAAFDRTDGRYLYFSYFGKQVGGTYALLVDDQLYTGTEEMIAHQQKSPSQRFAWFPGRKLVVTPDAYYLATERTMTALDRKTYPKASAARHQAQGQRTAGARALRDAKRGLSRARNDIKTLTAELTGVDKKLAEGKAVSADQAAELREERSTISRTLVQTHQAIEAHTKNIEKAEAAIAAANTKLKEANAAVTTATRWTVPCDASESLILAGTTLVAGGKDKVLAIDAAKGATLWTGKVDGRARGLAVADGKLFVSTDKGTLHSFGKKAAGAVAAAARPPKAPAAPKDELGPVFGAAAETIVKETGITKGYCLVLGSGTGRLALELAKRTELRIYGVDPFARNVAAARKLLDAAGVYGTRVAIEQAHLAKVPYSDYFANLIVSETALVSGKLPGEASEMFRMLKPCGGVAILGQPEAAEGRTKALSRNGLRVWLWKAGIRDWHTSTDNGLWARITRGPLEGAGSWTHQYAEPGNSACGDETAVRCPLGLLWFGEPGPGNMVQRHEGAASPLAIDGRLFVQGDNLVMAFDSYNGLKLWERPIQGARRTRVSREASNLALTRESLFVAVGDKCLRLDVATGETTATYTVPAAPDGKPRRWGYVATADGILYGTATQKGLVCDAIFAIDLATGKIRWEHRGTRISQITIAIGGGRLFLAESEINPEERQEALKKKLAALEGLKGKELEAAQKRVDAADVRRVVALDARSGRLRWQRPVEVTDCQHISAGGGELIAMVHDGILVFCAASTNGHFWRQFFAGEFANRTVIALAARNGRELWAKAIGYRHRPLIVGDMLVAEPWAFDLRTGEIRMRKSPLTGQYSPWQFARPGHHCGPVYACPTTLFFRSWTISYYDLLGDYGTIHFGSQRPGCWINTIPANGLVLAPEASSGCMCAFPNMCTVVFKPQKQNTAWALYSEFQRGKQNKTWGESNIARSLPPTPPSVEHVALNLGAPGDRRDDAGTLWLGFPRPRGSLVFNYPMRVHGLSGYAFYKHRPLSSSIQGTEEPWIYASGCRGLTRCELPLVREGQQPGIYTVRLGFVDPDNDQFGIRLFDVSLQGRTVLEKYDVFSGAGGRNRAVVKEFPNIQVDRDLVIELTPMGDASTRERMPVLNSIEVVRTALLDVSASVPSFLMSDLRPEQTRPVTVTNHTDEEVVARLKVEPPEGIAASPASVEVSLAPKASKTLPMKLTVAKGTAAKRYLVPIKATGPRGSAGSSTHMAVNYLGGKRTISFKAVEDAFVRKSSPKSNYGSDERLWVDGGDKEMGDASHCLVYYRFRLDVPGTPKSAKVRLQVGTWAAAQSGDSGKIVLVKGAWDEKTLTYENQPELGRDLAKIGRVEQGAVVERAIDVPLEATGEVSIALVPTGCDGCGYCSRESSHPPLLIVEFGE